MSWRVMLLRNQAAISMGRKGNVLDNAPMESFLATLKEELVHRDHYQTRREAKSKIFQYIEGYYNPVASSGLSDRHDPE